MDTVSMIQLMTWVSVLMSGAGNVAVPVQSSERSEGVASSQSLQFATAERRGIDTDATLRARRRGY